MAYTTVNKSTDHFNPKLYTGTGSTQSITGVGFQPDWTWIKNRSTTHDHILTDVVRGVTKDLRSNNTDAEATDSNGLTAFGADGFTVGSKVNINNNGSNIVSWNWKAGGTGSANTDGTISSTVSANTTAGFSIVSYTGTGSAGTVGHGLGSAPAVIITKTRTNTEQWFSHWSVLGTGNFMKLDQNVAAGTNATAFPWNPQASTFGLSTDGATNTNGRTYIAYCFAEKTGYSKFGKYTGNGSTDGAFVYTGFRPSWMMIKESSNAGNEWYISDGTRSPTNAGTGSAKVIAASGSGAEESGQSYNQFDIVSNGYKVRGDDTRSNGSGRTYIYMAFGQSIVGSNNIPNNAR